MARRNFEKIRAMGCRAAHVGGGEPLLRPEKLIAVLEVARAVGVSIEYVETNSSWFKDKDSAISLLSRLRNNGLNTLLVSISPFHNEQIPFARVQGVIDAAQRVGIGIFPWVTDFVSDLSSFDPAQPHSLDEYRQCFGDDYLIQIMRRYWIHLGGRALETFRPLLGKMTWEQVLEANPGGCSRELSDTRHFHIDLFGNYIPGLCSGLAISRTDLGTRLSPQKYPILVILFSEGIRGLASTAKEMYGFSPQRNTYINKCDLCTEIRTFMMKKDYRESDELAPEEFYSRI
jgi:hypothetical protein